MRRHRFMRHFVAWLAVSGICLSAQLVVADGRTSRTAVTAEAGPPVRDVALSAEGLLTGQLLDENFTPRADAEVAIQANERTVATTRTDAHGVFAVRGLHGGIHEIQTTDAAQVYRFWAPGTAPPQAQAVARIVSGADVVRGQWGGHNPYLHQAAMLATNPFVVGGVIAAAVAIPVVIHNSGSHS